MRNKAALLGLSGSVWYRTSLHQDTQKKKTIKDKQSEQET